MRSNAILERLKEYGWKPHRIVVSQTNILQASICRYMHKQQGCTFSSNSIFRTVLFIMVLDTANITYTEWGRIMRSSVRQVTPPKLCPSHLRGRFVKISKDRNYMQLEKDIRGGRNLPIIILLLIIRTQVMTIIKRLMILSNILFVLLMIILLTLLFIINITLSAQIPLLVETGWSPYRCLLNKYSSGWEDWLESQLWQHQIWDCNTKSGTGLQFSAAGLHWQGSGERSVVFTDTGRKVTLTIAWLCSDDHPTNST